MEGKKMSNNNPLIKDCEIILKENSNIDDLFSDLDNLLEYWFKDKFDIDDLFDSLETLGGTSFSKVTLFFLHNSSRIDFLHFLDLGIDKDLINNLKFITAKYSRSIIELRDLLNKEFGWNYANSSLITYKNESKFVRCEFELNNGTNFIIEDDADAIVQLCTSMLDGVLTAKKQGLPEKELEQLNEHLESLEENIKSIRNA
jgi:hypothetical protein